MEIIRSFHVVTKYDFLPRRAEMYNYGRFGDLALKKYKRTAASDANEAEIYGLLIGCRELKSMLGFMAIVEGDSQLAFVWGSFEGSSLPSCRLSGRNLLSFGFLLFLFGGLWVGQHCFLLTAFNKSVSFSF